MGGNSDIFRQGLTGNGEGVSRSRSHRSISPPGGMVDLDGPPQDYKPKFRSSNAYGNDRFSGPHGVAGGSNFDDLSLPSMNSGGSGGEKDITKFRSPQAVIDEALQNGAQNGMPKAQHHFPKRSLTPTRMRPTHSSSVQRSHSAHRRTNSFDVTDESLQRRVHRTGSSYSTSSASQLPQHSMIRQSPSGGNSSHRRARSGSINSNHQRSASRDDDIFLHGVVAQTRFI